MSDLVSELTELRATVDGLIKKAERKAHQAEDRGRTISELRGEVSMLRGELQGYQCSGAYEMGQMNADAALVMRLEELRQERDAYKAKLENVLCEEHARPEGLYPECLHCALEKCARQFDRLDDTYFFHCDEEMAVDRVLNELQNLRGKTIDTIPSDV